MNRQLKQSSVVKFDSLSVSKSKVVQLKFKMRYDEIVGSINLLQALNSDITLQARINGGKPLSLGMFNLNGMTHDKDGNANLPFKSMLDNVNMNNIFEIMGTEAEDIVQLRCMAVLELPDNDSEKTEEE